MPALIEAKSEHFGIGLIGGPVVERNTVGSDEDAGTVIAQGAVNEHLLRRGLTKKREESGELRGSRSRKARNGNGNKTNAESLGLRAFLFAGVSEFASQIDNGGDAEFLQF